MFRKANIRLTIFYSLLFLVSFWAFSAGLYFWMQHEYGNGYINEISQHEKLEGDLNSRDMTIATIAGNVAQNHLKDILLILNGALLIVVPGVAWLMTLRTLSPVQRIHDQQKQFVSDVAHELRTPLSIMSGEIEVALKNVRTPADYQSVLASGKQETERLIKLAEDLLFLASTDKAGQSVDFEKVDVTDVSGSVIASLHAESSARQIAVHFLPAAEPLFVFGQPAMIRRLFFNVIHNAIIYTQPGGEVWVTLSANKQSVQVKIKDNGIGITPQDRARIFNRFYRADNSRSQTKGYGLGLAISKSIVELHHGSISVQSAPGQGATFTITLPMAKH